VTVAYKAARAGGFLVKSVSLMGCGKKTMSDEKSFDRKTLECALAELGHRAFSPDNDTPTSPSPP
jgi:hypothetical protein